MLFSSPVFILFFLPYFILHFFVPAKYRLTLIVVGSLIFYGYWNPYYLWIPVLLITLAYLGALWAESSPNEKQKNTRFLLTLFVLFVPLFYFKYTNFFYETILTLLGLPPNQLINLKLPLGISFITFTLAAYLVDVQRKKFPVEKRFDELTGCVLFFPHLIAGPIVRPSQLIPQLRKPNPVLQARFLHGILLFSWGLVKKLVFADSVASFVNPVFNSGLPVSGISSLLAIYGYAVQIYCDFSGYSDMALGLALVLGIRLPRNFDRPYASASLVEFWRNGISRSLFG